MTLFLHTPFFNPNNNYKYARFRVKIYTVEQKPL